MSTQAGSKICLKIAQAYLEDDRNMIKKLTFRGRTYVSVDSDIHEISV